MTRSRRPRRLPRRAVAATVGALALLTLTVVFPGASARFTAVTANPAGAWATDGVAPPTGFSAAWSCAPAPPIAFRAATSATAHGVLTLPAPAGTVAGDVLLAQVAYGSSAPAPAAPAGWTLVRSDADGNAVTSALYWKRAVNGEGSSTFALAAGSTVGMAGGMGAWTGVSTTDPVEVTGGATGGGSTVTTPAVTTTTAGTRLVRLTATARQVYAAPAGTTERWRQLAIDDLAGVSAGDEPFTGPGTAPARTSTSSSPAANWVGQTVALRLAPGTPSATLTWTASPSSWATGYRLERSSGGTVQSTRSITPVGATSTTDGPLVNGTPYTFRLWAHRGTWTSTPVTSSLTPSC